MYSETINRPASHNNQARFYILALSFVIAVLLGLADHFIIYWNTIVRLLLLLIVVFLTVKIKMLNEHLEEKVQEKTSCLVAEIDEREKVEKERAKLISELQTALDEVKKLSGFFHVCASCKKIRDDKGYWNQLEVYISEHSEAQFSHGICPDCAKKLYPEFYDTIFSKHANNFVHMRS